MSKQDEAGLILKLYELRREDTMRNARNWYFREFMPESFAEVQEAMFSEHSGHLRMVVTYWDMAATLVNHGAIDLTFFTEANGEHFAVFGKIEPFIEEARASFGPQFLANLEKLIDATPNGRQRSVKTREMNRMIRAQLAARQAKV
jgi:hypothetical protein